MKPVFSELFLNTLTFMKRETVGWMTLGFTDCNMMQKGTCCMDSTTGKENL